MLSFSAFSLLSIQAMSVLAAPSGTGADVQVAWNNVLATSQTTTTLQEVVMPPLLSNSSVRDEVMRSLSLISSNYVRFVPWYPYPKLAVVELDPPEQTATSCTTSWNFTYADQVLSDFLKATPGKKHIVNFSTTPGWMWVNGSDNYPEDVNEIDRGYNQGTVLKDPTGKQVADYYERLLSWYIKGGFTDECGVYHQSDHFWGDEIDMWEVLNEAASEHRFTPESYNILYDAITKAVLEVDPDMVFVGGALINRDPAWATEFLDATKHATGTPIDWFSYHFYATPSVGTTQEEATEAFSQTDLLFPEIVKINEIREALNPDVNITINEVGTFDPLATTTINDYTIPEEYWSWSGGIFAYIFAKTASLNIQGLGQSQLYGYPGQYESVSLVYYKTGKPTARLRVLQLLQENFASGDLVISTSVSNETAYHAQAFQTTTGQKKILLINKLDQMHNLTLDGFDGGWMQTTDVSTGGDMYQSVWVHGNEIELTPYATVVLTASDGLLDQTAKYVNHMGA